MIDLEVAIHRASMGVGWAVLGHERSLPTSHLINAETMALGQRLLAEKEFRAKIDHECPNAGMWRVSVPVEDASGLPLGLMVEIDVNSDVVRIWRETSR